eukprot:Sspe_Gene.82730::Locus_54226_Transcript_1_1_Confidence_1.000_Length_505::g.82730::m.82730/K11253/H3; histone H3
MVRTRHDAEVHVKVTKKSKIAERKARAEKTQAKRKMRWRPGTVAVREIRRLRKSTHLLLQKSPFQSLTRTITARYKTNVLFRVSAMEAIQQAAEAYLVGVFEHAVILQLHRSKKTLSWKDLNYTRRIRGELLDD